MAKGQPAILKWENVALNSSLRVGNLNQPTHQTPSATHSDHIAILLTFNHLKIPYLVVVDATFRFGCDRCGSPTVSAGVGCFLLYFVLCEFSYYASYYAWSAYQNECPMSGCPIAKFLTDIFKITKLRSFSTCRKKNKNAHQGHQSSISMAPIRALCGSAKGWG